VLVALVLLCLAFLWSLRDRMYLAYAFYLSVMLLALWLRHPLAYRHAVALGVEPERMAAAGVLAVAVAGLGAVELMRVGGGIARDFPDATRWLRRMTLIAIGLGLIDVATIVSYPGIAHACFIAINAVFGVCAIGSGLLLALSARRGGRMPRIFLAGWSLLVLFGAWFSLGPMFGVPQPENPQRYILAACAVQGLIWAIALADRALRLQRERDHAKALAENDPLTGLPNRRAIDRRLDRAERGVVLLCDLDRFKAINDRFGHAAGDRCLQQFGRILADVFEGRGVVARYGGEEFLAICDEGIEQAAALAAHLRELTERTTVDLGGVRIVLTVSIGVARIDGYGAMAALSAADRALYRAKEGGRNRVELARTE
jgi:diguanylate cyclase (GGDEF)-like protein